MNNYIDKELKLEFNEKTQIFPIKNGVDYLGFHFYLTDTGKVVKKISVRSKKKFKRKLTLLKKLYAEEKIDGVYVKQVISSHVAHMSYGDTYKLRCAALRNFSVCRHPEDY